MNNILTRILLVVVSVPLLYLSALYIPQLDFIVLALVVLLFSAFSALELSRLCVKTAQKRQRALHILLGVLPGLVTYIFGIVSGAGVLQLFFIATITSMLLFLLSSLPLSFSNNPQMIPESIRASGTISLIVMYIGLSSGILIVLLNIPQHAGLLMIWFSMIVFANDSLAWLVGISVGKHRGLFKVSPKKSLEGLIAGMTGSVGSALLGPVLFPFIPQKWLILFIMGLFCGIASVAGDLFESSLKRSAEVKDSGSLIPGRGGFLDSFDSILFTAPIFFVFMVVLGILAS